MSKRKRTGKLKKSISRISGKVKWRKMQKSLGIIIKWLFAVGMVLILLLPTILTIISMSTE